jgi:cytochrome b subunit of formate dehydrogenase
MDVLMPPPAAELLRFSRAERLVHRSTAILMGVCLITAAILYVGALETLVGRRSIIEWIHVICGCALPVPTLIGLSSRAFRADLRRLNRFLPHDWKWLRSPDRRNGKYPTGKFNAGQKLNASFQFGGILIMLGTGLIMRFANHWAVSWRTGATFVHDWIAYAILAAVVGHIYMAMRDPYALGGMRTGSVPVSWARREHKAWAAEEAAAKAAAEAAARTVNQPG